MARMKNRLYEASINNEGYVMKIIEYHNNKDIWIEFQDEHKAKVHTCYSHFKNGKVKNPYHKSIYETGYLGQGRYSRRTHSQYYRHWTHMMDRCCNKKVSNLSDYFHNFQNFAEWCEENYYEIDGEKMCLDKDILIKNNRTYSPNNCMFVPDRINTLFCKTDKSRGSYPVGCSYNKERDMIEVHCSTLDKRKFLGYYNTIEEAFNSYKTFKESYIKQVADEYKDLIPQKLYEAMYNYEVEIHD